MNARETIQLIVEGKPPKGWATTRGVYANFSHWPYDVQYYVKCPKCGLVHGDFKSLSDANDKKLCPTCDVKVVNDLKDEVQKVLHDPDHKPKEMLKIVGEAIDPFSVFEEPPEGQPKVPVPPSDDPDLAPAFLRSEIERMLGDWVTVAMRQLAAAEDLDLSACEIDVDWSEREGNYDRDFLDDTLKFKVDAGDSEYLIFKDDSEGEKYALEIVRSDLENEPKLFSQDWLKNYIDEDRLRDALGDPHEEWEDDVRGLYYEDLLEKMVEEGYVESDDTVFFKKNGQPRSENALRVAALNVYMEDYIDKEKPAIKDPWEYLEGMYSEKEAIKWAIETVGFDIDKAAEGAVNDDGWPHFVARYDGDSHELDKGVVYCRLN